MSKLLLLEDDISLVDGLGYSLEKNGFEWEVARTVKEALHCLQRGDRYDLLLLDVTLPDGTGFEICERVRKQNNQIPIIFLTASDEERAHRRVRQNVDRGIGSIDYEEVLADLRRRDAADSSRATAPLRPAEDALQIDSTSHYIEEVIDQICTLARERM